MEMEAPLKDNLSFPPEAFQRVSRSRSRENILNNGIAIERQITTVTNYASEDTGTEPSELACAQINSDNNTKTKDALSNTVSTQLTTPKKSNKNKPKPLYFWNAADVNKWLKKHNSHYHSLYGELFEQQEITGRTLIRMNEIKLERVGITDTEHRNELMQYILRLRLRHEASDLKLLDQKGIGFELKRPADKLKHQSSKDKDTEKKK